MKALARLLGLVAAIVGIVFALTNAAWGQELNGRWDGAINVMGSQLNISVEFRADDSLTATIDIPQQGAMGIPLRGVTQAGDSVHFELMGGPGLAVFDGTVAGDSITGSFTQAGVEGTFNLSRAEPEEEAAATLPYNSEEIEFWNGSVRLVGTLTTPREGSPFPAVVLVSGSGPQTRDANVMGFSVFETMAHHLSRNGIAVFRYDDRGVGESGGDLYASTVEDFAYDAMAAVRTLAERGDIDAGRLGVLGHSEGGIVAPIAAVRSDQVRFIVLLAPPAVTGEEILLEQSELILEASGITGAMAEEQRQLQRMILQAAAADDGWEDVEAELMRRGRESLANISDEQRAAIGDEQAYLDSQIAAATGSARTRWFRHFLTFDPRSFLRQVDVPVLALFGGLDLQVPPSQNAEPLERALSEAGNENVTIETIAAANHLFQAANVGTPAEYATLPPEFVPELLQRLTSWINSR